MPHVADSVEIRNSFGESVQEYLDTITARQLSENTYTRYAHTLRQAGLWTGGAWPTRQSLTAWSANLTRAGLKATTIVMHLRIVRCWSAWAIKERHIIEDPSRGVPRPKLPKLPPRSLQQDVVQRILTAPDRSGFPALRARRDGAILALLYGAGLRIAELCSLDLHDLEQRPDGWDIRVRKGKGNKERLVPLADVVAEAVRLWLCQRPEVPPNAAMFVTRRGRISGNTVRAALAWYVEANLLPHATPHQLRHSFATHMLENGADIVSLAQLLGHADTRTTMRYLSASTAMVRRVYQATHPLARRKDS